MAQPTRLESWRSERVAAYLSRAVARAEDDPRKRTLFEAMAEAADEQAAILARGIDPLPPFRPSLRARLVAALTAWLGPRTMQPVLAAIKAAKLKVQPAIQGDELRITGKKRDDLQEAIALIKAQKIEQPLQYVNFRD